MATTSGGFGLAGVLLSVILAAAPAAVGERWLLGQGDFDDDPGASRMTLLECRSTRAVLGGCRLGYEVARTSRRATYLGPFLYRDFRLGRTFVFTPSFGAGWYDRGDDKDLRLALQFRSAADVAFDVGAGWRVGFMYHHLSNMSLTTPNPGAEARLVFVAKRF